MVNAHPSLLLYICKQDNILCDFLEEYVLTRDIKLKKFMEVRNLLLSVSYLDKIVFYKRDNSC